MDSRNYGEAEGLTDLLADLDIPYVHYIGAKYEYDGNITAFDPAAGEGYYERCTQDGEPYLTLSNLEQLRDIDGNIAVAIGRLQRVAPNNIPPVEIVEDMKEVAA